MGEPADDELFRNRHEAIAQELPARNEAVARSKADENMFRALMIDNAYETREVLTKCTRVLAVLTKILGDIAEKEGVDNPLGGSSATTPAEEEPVPA